MPFLKYYAAKWGRFAGPQICIFSFLQRQTDVSVLWPLSKTTNSSGVNLVNIVGFASHSISVSIFPFVRTTFEPAMAVSRLSLP